MSLPTLPTGTVTFLFTDIEGSTRLVQALGDGFVPLLERHNQLLRVAIDAHDGVVVKTEGDAFFAAFVDPVDAVAAAGDAQRALAGEPWPEGARVRVRMGVHTGTGSLGGDDYVGLDVHRAARVADAAHGGQTVMSEATAVLVERSLPPDLHLRDAGKHRLKDLAEPETLFELVVAGLEAEFPQLRTLEAIPNNLPLQVTSFVARPVELAEALRLLERTRVLTLTGPGGTGKTRLALEIGAELGGEFRDGVFFADLAPVSDLEVVPSQILASIGLQPPGGVKSPAEALVDHLQSREVLLILDNFEQIVGAAPLVAEMVRASPRSKFLVTSRGPLRISGEQEMPVPPLPLPGEAPGGSPLDSPAVQLFVERAMAARPDFALDESSATAVLELVRKLDGLPLAIELVAPQVRLLSVADIIERLDSGLQVSGAVDLPERQRTIEGAINWSYTLLDEACRRLFARLSVFRGGGRVDEIEQVCGGDGIDVIGGLVNLLDQSLVRSVASDTGSRFRMLKVISENAAARLAASGEEREIRHRHLLAYTAFVEAAAPHMLGHERRRWLDTVEADHDNLRAALDWAAESGETDLALRLAASTWRFWQARGHLIEAQRRLEAALALPGGALNLRAKAIEALGGVLWWQGKAAECLPLYREVLEIQRRLGNPGSLANALYNVGLALLFTDRDEPQGEEAMALLDEAESIYRQLGDVNGIGDASWGKGNALVLDENLDRADEARALFETATERYREAGNEFGMGWSLFEVAHLALRTGDLDTASRRFHEGLALFVGHHDLSAAVMFLAGSAGVALARGDDEEAARLAGAFHSLRLVTGTDLVSYAVNLPAGLEFETLEALTGDLAEAYRAGRAMDYDAAVAHVLGG